MATVVSPGRQDYRVETGTGHTAGFQSLSTDEVRNSFSSTSSPLPPTITAACGSDVIFSPTMAKNDDGGNGGGSSSNNSSSSQIITNIPQPWTSRFTEYTHSGTSSNYAQLGTGKGTLTLPKKGGWTVEQPQQTNPVSYLTSFEDVCYNNNTNNGNGNEAIRKTLYMNSSVTSYRPSTVHFSPGTRSGGSVSRSGVYPAGGPTDFSHRTNTTCTTPFVGCDSSSSTSASCRLMKNNTGGSGSSCGSGNVMGSNNILDVFQFSPLTNTPSMASSTAYYSTLDGVERLRVQPLRFKMLPSPVPYEMLFADNLSNPSPNRLVQYQAIMVRWYNHILVAQENARARIRQRCPPPPENVLQQVKPADPMELQTWSAQCCSWWDETSRRRTRRGHRGGKTPVGSGTARGATQQQQQKPSNYTSFTSDVKKLVAGQTTGLLCDLPHPSDTRLDEEGNFNWDRLIENIIGGDE